MKFSIEDEHNFKWVVKNFKELSETFPSVVDPALLNSLLLKIDAIEPCLLNTMAGCKLNKIHNTKIRDGSTELWSRKFL